MSRERLLVARAKARSWDVSGPHFAGWRIYHLKGFRWIRTGGKRLSRVVSLGQVTQRSNDGGKICKAWQQEGAFLTWLPGDSADQKKPSMIRPAFREDVMLIGNVA